MALSPPGDNHPLVERDTTIPYILIIRGTPMRLLTLAYSTDDYEGRPYVLITITREDAKKFIKRIRNAIRAKAKDNSSTGTILG